MVPIIFFFKYNIIIHNNSKFPIVLFVYFGIIIVIIVSIVVRTVFSLSSMYNGFWKLFLLALETQ